MTIPPSLASPEPEQYRRVYSNDVTPEYLDNLIRHIQRPLRGFIRNGLGVFNEDDADELMQEVILRWLYAFRNDRRRLPDVSTLDDSTLRRFVTALCQSAYYLKIDNWRKYSRRHEPLTEEAMAVIPDNSSRTEDQIILTMALEKAFASLPNPAWRPVAYLCLVEGRLQHHVATMLNLPLSKVNYYVNAARAWLREQPELQPFLEEISE